MNFLSDEQRGSLYAVISGLCYGFLGYFGVNLMNADLSVTNIFFGCFIYASDRGIAVQKYFQFI